MIILPGALPPGLSLAPGGSPQGVSLPWPEGALLPARLLPAGDDGMARLLLGQHRLLARVPPNVPMGHVWLELIRREMPARLQLLSEQQAAERLLHMLARTASRPNPDAGQAAPARHEAAMPAAPQAQPAAQPMKYGGPFAFFPTADPARWLIGMDEDDAPGGMLRIEPSRQAFLLEGRIDLARLGTVFFSLRGDRTEAANGQQTAMRLTVEPKSAAARHSLAPAMLAWLDEMALRFPTMNGGMTP